MTQLSFLFFLVPVIAGVLLIANYLFSVHKPDIQKLAPFECGFASFSQTRSPFQISFSSIGLLFMLFDLEVALLLPFSASFNQISSYALIIFLIFIIILTAGFIYEFAKGVLNSFGEKNPIPYTNKIN
jgi:NADH-quinone oxidoreductase subunit A